MYDTGIYLVCLTRAPHCRRAPDGLNFLPGTAVYDLFLSLVLSLRLFTPMQDQIHTHNVYGTWYDKCFACQGLQYDEDIQLLYLVPGILQDYGSTRF